ERFATLSASAGRGDAAGGRRQLAVLARRAVAVRAVRGLSSRGQARGRVDCFTAHAESRAGRSRRVSHRAGPAGHWLRAERASVCAARGGRRAADGGRHRHARERGPGVAGRARRRGSRLMRRTLALVLLLATAALVTTLAADEPRSIGFAFGFALIAAALAGD